MEKLSCCPLCKSGTRWYCRIGYFILDYTCAIFEKVVFLRTGMIHEMDGLTEIVAILKGCTSLWSAYVARFIKERDMPFGALFAFDSLVLY